MRQYKGTYGQTMLDVCLNTYGTLNYFVKLCRDNNVDPEHKVSTGDSFIWDETLAVDQSINRLTNERGVVYQTAPKDYFDEPLPPSTPKFTMEFTTTSANEEVMFQATGLTSSGGLININWGDGSPLGVADETAPCSHVFATPGVYRVTADNNECGSLFFGTANGIGYSFNLTGLIHLDMLDSLQQLSLKGLDTLTGDFNVGQLPNSLQTLVIRACGVHGLVTPDQAWLNLPFVSTLDVTDNPTLQKFYGPFSESLSAFQLNNNNLSVTSVNAILERLAHGGIGSGGFADLRQNPAAPPSGIGLQSVSGLQGNGWDVYTD